jgi:murein L,D-transpeptidase YafK
MGTLYKNNAPQRLTFLLRSFITLVLLLWGSLANIVADTHLTYEIIVIKSKRLLVVKKETQVIKEYRVALGQGGAGGKRLEGDRHTPEGKYTVVNFRPSNKFHYFIQLNYPSRQDAMTGFKKGLISWKELIRIYQAHQEKNGIPPQQTSLGGFVGIHGIGHETNQKLIIHRYFDWTRGCIALTNHEIDELRQFISLGTRVTILNEVDEAGDKEIFTGLDLKKSSGFLDF